MLLSVLATQLSCPIATSSDACLPRGTLDLQSCICTGLVVGN